ncbi:unnamed protein product [Meganyctiphanes norvegica]|uniref:PPM-type phosphatase domain-containing protein n=1 Tax=Meganyctiphanes norvegica TaxID=48144 RepID=A0AAV2Q2U1_MEGNR
MSSRVGVNLRASAYLHQGDRKYMEDEFQVAYQRTADKKDIEYAFFGIFDGHGGKEAAHYAKDNLMDNIVSQRAFWSDDDEDVLAAIKEGFLQTHMNMWKVLDQWPRTASGWPSTSGTTASVAFIRKQKIYIGHVGDSGIVLGLEDPSGTWRGEALTRDHKPESVAEKARITESGGKVINKSGVPRVVWNRPKTGHNGPIRRSTPMDEIPFLAVARSLGDLWSYNPNNDQFVVSPEPDVCVVPIDITRHRCLIFGTDGLWNVLNPDAAVGIGHSAEKNNEKHYLGIPTSCGKQRLWVNPSRSVVSGALDRYLRLSLRADNTSAVTVFLDPPGRPKREVLLQQKGMKKGTPVKSPVRKPSTEESDHAREATVKVHVYNQSQTTRHEGSRGMLRIKERLPEKWQQSGNQDPEQENQQPSEDMGTDPECRSPEEGCTSEDLSNTSNDRLPTDPTNVGTSKVGCSECGCSNKHKSVQVKTPSVDNSSNKRQSFITRLPSTLTTPIVPSTTPSMVQQSERDPIQIPVVSSSTLSPSSETRSKKIKVAEVRRTRTRSTIGTPHNKSSDELYVVNDDKEQTPLATNNNNEWKEIKVKEEKAGTSSKRRNSIVGSLDSSNRVLKSVNRSSTSAPGTLADIVPTKSLPSKRKRLSEVLSPSPSSEPVTKSLRVSTRSKTESDKSMVTRSKGGSPRKMTPKTSKKKK